MTTLLVLPAVGGGLDTMARAGQLDRLRAYITAWGATFSEIVYISYLDAATESRHLAMPADGSVRSWAGPWPWHRALRRPLHRAEREIWRNATVMRCMNLLATLPALTAHARWGVPFVVSMGADYQAIARIHGDRWQIWKWALLRALVMRRAAAVIVPNPVQAVRMQDRYPMARIVNIPNWVDTEHFCPAGRSNVAAGQTHVAVGAMADEYTSGPPSFILLYVGRLVAEKNLPRFAAAMRDLRVDGWAVQFMCVGNGPEYAALRRLGVSVPGAVPWLNLPVVYENADAFVLPSLSEGHPKSLLEAMACGLPCLVSDRVEGVIRHGETGWVFGAEDPGSMRRAVTTVLADASLRDRLGAAARAEAERYGKDRLLQQECNLLLEVTR